MNSNKAIATITSIVLGSILSVYVEQALAANPQYVLGLAHGVKAALWLPPNTANSHVGIITIHRTSISQPSILLEPVAAGIYGALHEQPLRQ